jgi:hypothetical protein
MRLGRGLASWICAAVFVIAAQFVVGQASAHTGYPHIHVSAAPMAHGAQHGHDGSKQAESRHGQSDVVLTSSARGDLPLAAQPGGCTSCCCSSGVGCCGAAMAASLSVLPDLPSRQVTSPRVSQDGAGIDPDSLRRPPRPLA